MSVGLALGLAAAIGYGVGDLLGGVAGRRLGTLPVLVVGNVAGLLALVAATTAVPAIAPSPGDLRWAVVAGLGTAVGGALLVRGMQVGRVGVVVPVSAVTGAGVPVVLDVAAGTTVGPGAVVGSVLGLVAIWLVGGAAGVDGAGGARGLLHGLGAGVGFAILYLGLDRTSPATGAWPAVTAQAVVVGIVVVAAFVRGRPVRVPARSLPIVVGYGIAGALATLAFLLAARAGAVGVAALLASMSPAVTVVLGRFVLAEPLTRRRVVGLVASVAALVLIDAA